MISVSPKPTISPAMGLEKKIMHRHSPVQIIRLMPMQRITPLRIRSSLPAPRFWPEKVVMAMPKVALGCWMMFTTRHPAA